MRERPGEGAGVDDPTTGTEAQDVYQRLAAGPAHSFSDVAAIAAIPRLPGVYCIWDADGTFLYTGIAGPGIADPRVGGSRTTSPRKWNMRNIRNIGRASEPPRPRSPRTRWRGCGGADEAKVAAPLGPGLGGRPAGPRRRPAP